MTNRHQTYIGSVGLAETRGLESLKITEVKRISDGMRRRQKITKASGNAGAS